MTNAKSLTDQIAALNESKYDKGAVSRYASAMKRHKDLVDRGLIIDEGYRLKTADTELKLIDVLTINKKQSMIYK
ncbi:MAG TPA: hypothetical protein GX398_03125 [Candidatus Cloacimonetes bacterium]|jgi:uncharacterized tellurite resistance protein B-like protein|nr:hypothetical protein [Candidatus Cloacimonadota bacterium]